MLTCMVRGGYISLVTVTHDTVSVIHVDLYISKSMTTALLCLQGEFSEPQLIYCVCDCVYQNINFIVCDCDIWQSGIRRKPTPVTGEWRLHVCTFWSNWLTRNRPPMDHVPRTVMHVLNIAFIHLTKELIPTPHMSQFEHGITDCMSAHFDSTCGCKPVLL